MLIGRDLIGPRRLGVAAPFLPRFSLKGYKTLQFRWGLSEQKSRGQRIRIFAIYCRAAPAFSLFKTGAFNHSATPPEGVSIPASSSQIRVSQGDFAPGRSPQVVGSLDGHVTPILDLPVTALPHEHGSSLYFLMLQRSKTDREPPICMITPSETPARRATPRCCRDVSRGGSQQLIDLRRVPGGNADRDYTSQVYELPFQFTERTPRSALVVGADGGNDVAAALRHGFTHVVSVDIDPAILYTGEELHPERPYSDARVTRVADDARAFLGRRSEQEKFDVICYGLLDSHAMFSSMSSLRLDNFVYTEEGFAAAWKRVKDEGILSVSFSVYAGEWMYYRMLGLVKKAPGIEPIVVRHGYDFGATFLAGRTLTLAKVRATMPGTLLGERVPASIRVPSDDWPFLYLRLNTIPWNLHHGVPAHRRDRRILGAARVRDDALLARPLRFPDVPVRCQAKSSLPATACDPHLRSCRFPKAEETSQ
jgi:hypothetical protein